ncbi:hypothetical protein [Trichothermofontia sp.]
MNSDTLQWLTEIQALQRRVMALQQERDEWAATAQRWQKLYETEAQQRRSDAAAAQATIAQLQADLAVQSPINGEWGGGRGEGDAGSASPWLAELQARCDRIQTVVEAQTELQSLLLTCAQLQRQVAQLSYDLATEQAAHQHTRKTLTLALGDTIDLLTQERQRYQGTAASKGVLPN